MSKNGCTVRHARNVECRKMSDKETIRFVELYRDNECLWDNAHDHYKLKDYRLEAYRNLMVEMDMESVAEVKKKLKSIRDTYTSEKNKMLRSNYSYKTKLVWYPILDEFISKCGGGYERDMFEMTNYHAPTAPSSPEVSFNSSIIAKKKRRCKSKERIRPVPRKPPRKEHFASLQHHDVKDEFHYFGLSIASQLRSMPRLDALLLQDSLHQMMSAKRIEIESRELIAECSGTEETQTLPTYSSLPDSSVGLYSDGEIEFKRAPT